MVNTDAWFVAIRQCYFLIIFIIFIQGRDMSDIYINGLLSLYQQYFHPNPNSQVPPAVHVFHVASIGGENTDKDNTLLLKYISQ